MDLEGNEGIIRYAATKTVQIIEIRKFVAPGR